MSGPVLRQRSAPPRRQRDGRLPAVAVALVAAGIAIAILVLSGGDSDEPGPKGGDSLERLAAGVVDDMSKPWPDVQRDNGHFRSAVGGGTRYGEAMLGYALLQTAHRTGDDELADAAFKGFRFALHRPQRPNRPSAFENFAMASGYNVAREHYADDPRFQRLRPQWERFLRLVRVDRLGATTYYGNHWLVEAVLVQELLRSGLRSDDRFAVLGGYRADASRLSEELINRRIPAMARDRGRTIRGERTFVLSDPPEDPLAYQGLSLGMYARAIELLGPRARPAARRTLRQVANASTWLAAPDGDLAYAGRNQEEIWAPAATAYGASVAAAGRGSSNAAVARYRALAERELERIRDVYGAGHFGPHITPAVRQGRRSAEAGLDKGAGGPSFGGLALAFVELTLSHLERLRGEPIGRLHADGRGRAVLGEGESTMAVVRTGRIWFAVRRSRSGKAPYDLRYDSGLIALKVRRPDGSWSDASRLRPLTLGDPDSAGPVLRTAGSAAIASGDDIAVARDGTVTVRGGWHSAPILQKQIITTLPWGTIVRGQTATEGALVRGATFTYRPVECGVEVGFPVQAGDRMDYSVFFRERPRISPTTIEDGTTRVTLTRPARTTLEPGHASGSDPKLVRAHMRFAGGPAGTVGVRICSAG